MFTGPLISSTQVSEPHRDKTLFACELHEQGGRDTNERWGGVRAEILRRGVQASEPAALGRLRTLLEFRKADGDTLRLAAPGIQRKHCLAVITRELGFASWDHARRVLDGDSSESDFGKLLYGAET